jgi:hypothetical protein
MQGSYRVPGYVIRGEKSLAKMASQDYLAKYLKSDKPKKKKEKPRVATNVKIHDDDADWGPATRSKEEERYENRPTIVDSSESEHLSTFRGKSTFQAVGSNDVDHGNIHRLSTPSDPDCCRRRPLPCPRSPRFPTQTCSPRFPGGRSR